MNCKDFREVADSYLSDELLTETNHDMISHMEACGDCRAVIEARREIRSRLKSAVLSSPEFRLDENFNHNFMTQLRHEQTQAAPRSSWFSLRSLVFAAGLLVVGLLSYGVLFNTVPKAETPYMVAGLSSENLVNIAAADHQHCAIEHKLDELPTSLKDGDGKYAGLESIVKTKLGAQLANHKLVQAHSCMFKDVRFAQFVLADGQQHLSVLLAPSEDAVGQPNDIRKFSTEAYEIASFDSNKQAVFVISDLDQPRNFSAAKTLSEPIDDYFRERNTLKTAILTSFAPRGSIEF